MQYWWSKRDAVSPGSLSEHKKIAEKASMDSACEWTAWVETYSISIHLTIGSYIEQPTGGIIGSGAKSLTIWEELHGINIWLMASKGLHGFPSTNIPKLGKCIACTGDENILISRVYADAHNVA